MHQYYSFHLLDELFLRASVFVFFSMVFGSVYLRIATPRKPIIPRIGLDPRRFSLTSAREDFLKNGHKLIREGYAKVS
jgi:hypothetical protein